MKKIDYRLFQISDEGELDIIGEKEPKKEKEHEIKKLLFHNNFNKIFCSDLILLTKSRIHEIKHGEQRGKKLDDLVFGEKEGNFYILEYKREKQEKLTTQGCSYRSGILSHTSNLHNLRDNYLEDIPERKMKEWGLGKDVIESDDKDWEKRIKVICLAPDFTHWQGQDIRKELTLIKWTKYQNKTLFLTVLMGDEKLLVKPPSEVRIKNPEVPIDEERGINQFLKGRKVSPWMREKILKINESILKFFKNSNNSVEGKGIQPYKGKFRYFVYKRKEKWSGQLLFISLKQKEFWIHLVENKTIAKLEKVIDGNLPKDFTRVFKIENEDEKGYQEFCQLLPAYLKETSVRVKN